MKIAAPVWSVGAVIAVIVLVIAIVLMVIGQLEYRVGGLIAALAVARLL